MLPVTLQIHWFNIIISSHDIVISKSTFVIDEPMIT